MFKLSATLVVAATLVISAAYSQSASAQLSASALADTSAALQTTLQEYRMQGTLITVPSGNRNEHLPFHTAADDTRKRFGLQDVPKITQSNGQRVKDPNFRDSAEDTRRVTEKALADARGVLLKLENSLPGGGLIRMINQISPLYHIPPAHVIGAMVGEHTFNVGLFDSVQNLVVNRLPGWMRRLASNEHQSTRSSTSSGVQSSTSAINKVTVFRATNTGAASIAFGARSSEAARSTGPGIPIRTS